MLNLLRLEAQKFSKLVSLVESLAWQDLKESVAPQEPTIMDREELIRWIPWSFVPNVDDYGKDSRKLLTRNQAKFKQLKQTVKALQELLEKAELTCTPPT